MFIRLPDGLTRRGDINLLMLGDPGTAKSQLLKFVERCSPIGVSPGWFVMAGSCCCFLSVLSFFERKSTKSNFLFI